MNRDPIEELGGKNIYAFDQNNLVNQIDALGFSVIPVIVDEGIHTLSWFEWVAWFKENNRKLDGNIRGVTKYNASVIVSGKKEGPCSCSFNIKSIKLNVGIWILDGDFTPEMDQVIQYHEQSHRSHLMQVLNRYASILTEKDTCCYTRGFGPFRRNATQSQEDCEHRASVLGQNILSRLSDYVKTVGEALDSRAGVIDDANTLEDQRLAVEAVNQEIPKMQMEDWTCSDTHGFFF